MKYKASSVLLLPDALAPWISIIGKILFPLISIVPVPAIFKPLVISSSTSLSYNARLRIKPPLGPDSLFENHSTL